MINKTKNITGLYCSKNLNNKKGFTLVETIVIAVIVAVLALLAVQFYSYIVDARRNTAQITAASAAGFLNTAINLGVTVDNNSFPDLMGSGQWDLPMPSNVTPSIFKCPAGVIITVNTANKTVKASIKGTASSDYKYDK
jgi:type II secretory pathway pseudopilin PulG